MNQMLTTAADWPFWSRQNSRNREPLAASYHRPRL